MVRKGQCLILNSLTALVNLTECWLSALGFQKLSVVSSSPQTFLCPLCARLGARCWGFSSEKFGVCLCN